MLMVVETFREVVLSTPGKVKSQPAWVAAHRAAVAESRKTYIDPQTGYKVMTELAHASRGFCCGNGCRHCPWNSSEDTKRER